MQGHDKDENRLARDIMKDLDEQYSASGKEWSIDYAKKLGMSDADIDKYIKGKKDETDCS
jgi:predicted transcriptional regulator YheO